ncbi:hypothetical protein ANN_03924 [Periplaneta americana]|uniref:Uncharacterized protein n=1 Tax=Periplaneta americana TaxID=6978 RepID=A0ABQ8T8P2_PERAM|nr:hypothetical protein ANN_03924 [Periplaneta americana]
MKKQEFQEVQDKKRIEEAERHPYKSSGPGCPFSPGTSQWTYGRITRGESYNRRIPDQREHVGKRTE